MTHVASHRRHTRRTSRNHLSETRIKESEMTVTYKLNGEAVRRSKALAHVIDAFAKYGISQPMEYFHGAEQQTSEGEMARAVVEGNSPVTFHFDDAKART
jgi:hypothetical protein